MEVSGVAFHISSAAAAASSSGVRQFSGGSLRFSSIIKSKKSIPRLRLSRVSSSATNCNSTSGFCDNAHVEYYAPATAQKKKEEKELKKTMKKKLKLIKGLSKDLSALSDMGFGLDPDADSELAYQFKGKMISEATELLLGQLRAEQMELKRKKKEEKAKLRAAKMMQKNEDSSSSSSSSESSDSECEGEVVDLSRLKTETETVTPQPQSFINQESMAPVPPPPPPTTNMMDIRVLGNNILNSNLGPEKKKIQVCMGGKCKKSGAPLLMEEFHKAAVGMEGEFQVVGCKCMGKCRDGPNVRVESNPLCIGVGLEDVGFIVSKFVGGSELGLATS